MNLFNFFDTIYPIGPEAKKALEQITREKSYAKNDAVISGITADLFGIDYAIYLIGH